MNNKPIKDHSIFILRHIDQLKILLGLQKCTEELTYI